MFAWPSVNESTSNIKKANTPEDGLPCSSLRFQCARPVAWLSLLDGPPQQVQRQVEDKVRQGLANVAKIYRALQAPD